MHSEVIMCVHMQVPRTRSFGHVGIGLELAHVYVNVLKLHFVVIEFCKYIDRYISMATPGDAYRLITKY